jgi:hypothetical protein
MRHKICDVLDHGDVLRGEEEDVKARLRRMPEGQILAEEYCEFRNGGGYRQCPVCYMKQVYDRLSDNMKSIGEVLDRVKYVEVECRHEDLKEERSCLRFTKQTSEPLLDWAYVVDPSHEMEGKDCVVKIIFTTQSGKNPKTQLYERTFPEGSIVRSGLPTTMYDINVILGRDDVVKHGSWNL